MGNHLRVLSAQRELSNEYQHDRVSIISKLSCALNESSPSIGRVKLDAHTWLANGCPDTAILIKYECFISKSNSKKKKYSTYFICSHNLRCELEDKRRAVNLINMNVTLN